MDTDKKRKVEAEKGRKKETAALALSYARFYSHHLAARLRPRSSVTKINSMQQLPELQEIADLFQSVEPDMRLEMLLDYARKLPPIPQRFAEMREAGLHKVPECMTPVFMFNEMDDEGNMRLHVDVAEEAPTVQGLMSILVHTCDAKPPAAVAEVPADLLQQLGLHQCIGAQRTMGFSGILGRIKRQAADLAAAGDVTADERG